MTIDRSSGEERPGSLSWVPVPLGAQNFPEFAVLCGSSVVWDLNPVSKVTMLWGGIDRMGGQIPSTVSACWSVSAR